MYHFVTASKDATIYKQNDNQNTGLDEILEVGKTYYGTIQETIRSLIKFDVTDITSSFESADLVMYSDETSEVPLDYTLYAFPVSQSWDMGVGTRFDEITTQGVTWEFRTSDRWSTGSFSTNSTGSSEGGGTWYTSSEASQTFSYTTSDINMDVTDIVSAWQTGSISNDGLILKFSDVNETDDVDYGLLQFFSKETNTVYQPTLRIGWDDQTFSTGSLTSLGDVDEIIVKPKRLRKEYKRGSVSKIRILGRELYPLKTYGTQFAYSGGNYLPQSSYYQVKDAATDEIIVPFSDYTKISCDSSGNFINLNLKNWNIHREYYFEFKVTRNGADEFFTSENQTFIVIN